jgi:hypothetical protein
MLQSSLACGRRGRDIGSRVGVSSGQKCGWEVTKLP